MATLARKGELMKPKSATRLVATTVGLALTLAACSSNKEKDPGSGGSVDAVGAPAVITHIHGLGVNAQGVLHVATHHGLITQSTNGSWVYASEDRFDHMGFSLHPSAGVMYRSGHSQPRPNLGVESSSDGAQWTHLSDVASSPVDFHAMAVSYADANDLWGWGYGSGMFRSEDGGKTWASLKGVGQTYVLAAPRQDNVVFAGTATGLHRSTNGGATWTRIPAAASGFVIALAADPADPKRMMAFTNQGLKSTADGGVTWKQAGGGLPVGLEVTSLTISPTDPKIAYAADSATIFQSKDGGTTWTAIYQPN